MKIPMKYVIIMPVIWLVNKIGQEQKRN